MAVLTPKQKAFVDEYLVDLNATQAAMRAGYSEKTARQIGEQNLSKLDIQQALQRRMKEREERTEITQDQVLQKWWALANADANELVEFRRGCCRFCHGEGNRYQRTQAEYLNASKEGDGVPEAEDGGTGFNPKRAPNPECPECFGDGHGYTVFKDTRSLSASGRELYAGVKQTKEGLEVKMQARDKALEMVGRHLGMFIDRKEVGGPGDFEDLKDDELDRRLAEADRAIAEGERAIGTARSKAAETTAAQGKAAPPRKA
jgi:phage terminase small subunit